MPELPDLQVFSKNLQKQIGGKTVTAVTVVIKKKLNVSVPQLKKALEHQLLRSVKRKGKELHLEFKNGNVLGLHLMLHGGLVLFKDKELPKHTIIALRFENDTSLAMVDYQAQATPTLNPPDREAPDALSKGLTVAYLKKRMAATRSSVKNVLLNQEIIRGIGNAYADEILWDAGISPFSSADKIPGDKIKILANSIRKVLKEAQKEIIKTHPDIIAGEVRDFLRIHNAKRKTSPTGAPMLNKSVSSRKTYYTNEQELYE